MAAKQTDAKQTDAHVDGDTRWLTESEQRSWRAWLAATRLLPDLLSRDLQRTHGLTLADYEILVRLSEAPDRRIRMSDLAELTLSSRSRLSHQIDRMERDGLVLREVCTEDRRGYFAVLSDRGWDTLVAAAPDHVASVRRHLVDVLTSEQFTDLGDTCMDIVEHIGEGGGRVDL